MACEVQGEGDSSPLATSPSTQRKQDGNCFGCGQEGHWISNCPTKIGKGSSTPGSRNNVPVLQGEGDSSPLATSPSTQRKQDGNCFGCGQEGHWISNCPTKIGKGSSTPGSRNNVPVLRCGCHRTCFVRVSHSEKNPERKYYFCSECKFIDFCDNFEALMCPCGAGFCTINLEGDGEKRPKLDYRKKQNKRCYYTCRIRTGHGACGFTQLGSAQHPWTSQVAPISSPKHKTPLEETPTHHTVARNQQDSSDGCSLVPVEGRIHVSGLGSQSEIRGRQIAFCNQMSSAGDSPTQCKIVYILGLRIFGWLGRLVFPPSPSLADPPFYYIYDHNRTSSIRLLSHAPSVNVVALEQVSPASPREDAHPSGIPSSHKRLRSAGQNDPLLKDLMERHMMEKCRHDDICQMHQEALSAFTTCDKQLQSLRERSAFIRNMLGEVEKLLLPCETETEKLKNDVQELSKQLMHSKRKMQVTSRELREAVRDML